MRRARLARRRPSTDAQHLEVPIAQSRGDTVACTWTALTGSTLTVRQTPAPDNIFTGWGGSCGGTGVVCTIVLDADRSVSAAWTGSTGVLLTVSVSAGGTVTGAGISCPSTCTATEALNSTVVLTATPAQDQVFTGWDGACSGSGTGGGSGGTATSPPSSTATPTPTSGGAGTFAAWQAGHGYKTGDKVSYLGHDYKCIQAHTSLVGWEPPNVPALWQLLS